MHVYTRTYFVIYSQINFICYFKVIIFVDDSDDAVVSSQHVRASPFTPASQVVIPVKINIFINIKT